MLRDTSRVEELRDLLYREAKKGLSLAELVPLSQKLDVEIYREMLKINSKLVEKLWSIA